LLPIHGKTTRRVLLLSLLLGAALSVYVWRDALRGGGKEPEQEAPWKPPPRFDRFHIRGLEYTSTLKGEKIFTLRAEEMTHRKRKVGPFTLNPIKEIEIKGMRLELYSEDFISAPVEGREKGTAYEGFSIPVIRVLQEAGSGEDLGFISRIIVDGIEIGYAPAGTERFRLRARRAHIQLGEGKLEFEGEVRFTFSGASLDAEQAAWDDGRHELSIPGPYGLVSPSGESIRGTGGAFRILRDGAVVQVL